MHGTGSLSAYAGDQATISGSSSLVVATGVKLTGSGSLVPTAGPAILEIGMPKDGAIVSPRHYWYQFSAVAGLVYDITTRGPNDATDTTIFLYDTDGQTLLVENDDFESSLSGDYPLNISSRIIWTCPASGTYYLMVQGYDDVEEGEYTALITIMPEPETISATFVLYGAGQFALRSLAYLPALGSLGGVANPGFGEGIAELVPLCATGSGGFYIPAAPVFGYGNLQPVSSQGHIVQTNPITGDAGLSPFVSLGADFRYGIANQSLPPLRGLGIQELLTYGAVELPHLAVSGEAEFQNNFLTAGLHGFTVELTGASEATVLAVALPAFGFGFSLGPTLAFALPALSVAMTAKAANQALLGLALPGFACTMAGGAQLSLAMPAMGCVMEGAVGVLDSVPLQLPRFGFTMLGSVQCTALLSFSLPTMRADFSGQIESRSELRATFSPLTVQLAGTVTTAGSLAAIIPMFDLTMTGDGSLHNELLINLPRLSTNFAANMNRNYGAMRHTRNMVN